MRCLKRRVNQLMNTWLNSKVEYLVSRTWKAREQNGFLSGDVDAAAKNICMSLIFILEKRKKQSLGLGKQLFWISMKNYKIHTLCFTLTTLILQHWLRSFSIREYTALVQFKVTGQVTRYEKRWHKFFICQKRGCCEMVW